jgi:hypothetical protein
VSFGRTRRDLDELLERSRLGDQARRDPKVWRPHAEASNSAGRLGAFARFRGRTAAADLQALEAIAHRQPDAEAPACNGCNASFGKLKRKHHCRLCGLVFCSACCSKKAPVPSRGEDRPALVCNECFPLLTGDPGSARSPPAAARRGGGNTYLPAQPAARGRAGATTGNQFVSTGSAAASPATAAAAGNAYLTSSSRG